MTGPRRGLDEVAVSRWLATHVEGVQEPVRFSLVSGGHSNITYGVEGAGGRRLVLRRPPFGELPPGAHDVVREHRILAALGGSDVPVPRVAGVCEDPSVIGAPFYVMDWVDGHVLARVADVHPVLPDAAARRRASAELIDVLAALHRVEVDEIGLGGLSRHEDFLARQLRGLARVWERTRTRELPVMDELRRRLDQARPEQRRTGLVHSDYRLGNVMVAPDGKVLAVLDWELCTIGDVLADVGFLLDNWEGPDDDGPQVWMEVPPTVAGGFLDRGAMHSRYEERTGFDLGDIGYYRAFAYWRVAVIAEGIKRRYESAAMASADVDPVLLERRVRDLADLGLALLD